MRMYVRWTLLRSRLTDEAGFGTAELLGNAALGVAALVVIWALLQGLGASVVRWIRGEIM
jgi:hypothetical protein